MLPEFHHSPQITTLVSLHEDFSGGLLAAIGSGELSPRNGPIWNLTLEAN